MEEKEYMNKIKELFRKEQFLYLLTVFISVLLLVIGWLWVKDEAHIFQNTNGDSGEEILCKVLEISDDDQTISSLGDMYYLERNISFDALILKGSRKGEIISVNQMIDNVSTLGVIPVEVGDKLFAYSTDTDGVISWHAGDYYRSGIMAWLLLLFCIAIIALGRIKGFNTILSLGLTCGAVFLVFVPSILAGYDPYIISCITCIYSIFMTLLLVSGYTKKTLVSALGCFGGVLVAGLLTIFMSQIMNLSGFVDDDSLYVYLLNPDKPINLNSIIFAANIIGALGATMDVAMSLASSLGELAEKVPDISFMELCRSGIHIGQDMMATMANTLVLAYIGSSLSTVLLFISYQASLIQLLNRELIVVELLQALSGSIGILCTIPISTVIAGLLYHKKSSD